jgi:hypothetical protein
MLDRYVYGTVERVSPEAPVPILAVERELAMPGGAGNVVRNLTALGAAVAFISVVGDDQAGSDLTGLIGGQPNIEPWLLVQGGRTTTLKTRLLAAGQHLLRTDREETSPIQPRLADRRSERPRLFALRRRRHHHAEPHRPGRGDRDAGGQRGGDRFRRDRAAPASRLRRGGGDARQ